MGKKEHCSYCFEFYRRTCGSHWGRNRDEVPGCANCYSRHVAEVSALKGKVESLAFEIEQKQEFYETEKSKLLATSSRDFLGQKMAYEKLLSDANLNSNLEISKLKAEKIRQRKKVQFLQVPRDSLHGDVILAVPGLQITANRAILASKSPLFEKVVPQVEEKPTKIFNIDEIEAPVLEAMVDFCYSGEITFSDLVAPDEVLKAAHTFELKLLMEYCDAELCRRLTVDNVPQMLKLSRKFEAKELQEAAWKIFKEHFDTLKNEVYEVLEGPDNSKSTFSTPSQAIGPYLNEKSSIAK